jgi:hypothetical protein
MTAAVRVGNVSQSRHSGQQARSSTRTLSAPCSSGLVSTWELDASRLRCAWKNAQFSDRSRGSCFCSRRTSSRPYRWQGCYGACTSLHRGVCAVRRTYGSRSRSRRMSGCRGLSHGSCVDAPASLALAFLTTVPRLSYILTRLHCRWGASVAWGGFENDLRGKAQWRTVPGQPEA